MAVTKSWEQRVVITLDPAEAAPPEERRQELPWLIGASVMVLFGLLMAGFAKTQNFPDLGARLGRGELLNLNAIHEPEQLLPFLIVFPPDQRQSAAEKIWTALERSKPLPNVGALARIRAVRPAFAKLKPLLVVRTPREFWQTFALWLLAYFSAFYVVHFVWRWRRFRGDPVILPALHLLSGIGLTLAISLRDPLRDTLEFSKFAWGAALGCLLLLLPLVRLFNYRRFSTWVYTPLLASFLLFVLLLLRGSGPTGSDSRVNLGPAQPVEAIKVLLAFFMAGYFTSKWERLRDLRQKRLVPRWLQWMEIPRFAHVLPVMCAVGCSLLLFFLLKDLGPALVTGFLFLVMFALARGRSGLAVAGIILLVAGVTIGYRLGEPKTVVNRIDMWLAPWDNNVRGGDQLAHSLWALSTGGIWGSGPGWGDPVMIPAGHTDLVLPAIGEEWGFVGVLSVCLLFAFLVHRCYRIALEASEEYGMFLALALGSLVALEMLLISGGVLGAIPLSGVVSPFLSSGNSAMLANFFIFALILGISNRPARSIISKPFTRPVRALAVVLGGCALALVARAGYFQALHDNDYLARDTKVIEDDGVKRAEHNPRLNSLAREIPRGNIYDRSGILLATSSWSELERRRAEYEKLGVSIEQHGSPLDNRHYPFGAAAVHVLGDLRTGDNFHASNASLIEHDLNIRLQGYSDYRELAPIIRYRHQPGGAALRPLLDRPRDVRTAIDVRLQMAIAEILTRKSPANNAAAVVMSPATGDVLALVNTDPHLDRARYGLYPPGSTFKLVTAVAALRIDPELTERKFTCHPVGGGRAGTEIPGWRKIIRDDIGDHAHGTLTMGRAITVSCNAYFAQLGVFDVGAQNLHDTAQLLDIPAGDVPELKKMMPFAAYGQGPVLVTPFKMARVAATIAAGGAMPQGRWILDETNPRTDPPRTILPAAQAGFLAESMRSVVTSGTARRAMAGSIVSVAGKTGTAQLDEGQPHSWFAGFAPYDGDPAQRIAFAVVVEHGGYGGSFAAPIAKEIVEAARKLGIVSVQSSNTEEP
jgi:cell division protein FtsW (lipid II flippase)/cell division protein FtsI/penicillin-binding protein 2